MISLAEVASAVGGVLSGPDRECGAVVTDTRAVTPGALFVALKGVRFDGHDFIPEASRLGASGVLGRIPAGFGLSTVVVPDVRHALGELAAYWRHKMAAKIVGITGSNGKTSVKEMVASIFRQAGFGLATEGNLNNDIGMPLTLLRLRPAHQYAIVEIGMNQPGEIAHLAAIAAPDIAVVTNAGAAHLAGLGSVKAVAAEKGQIFVALRPDGVAIVNHDDPYAEYWRGLWAGRTMTFGLNPQADVSATYTLTSAGSTLAIRAPTWPDSLVVTLSTLGQHNVMNALAATAVAVAYGVSSSSIVNGLTAMRPVHGRMESHVGRSGARIIDDSYNANPDSARAAIKVLADLVGERWLILGDMAELGPDAPRWHAELGAVARAAGIEHVWTLGTFAAEASAGGGGRHYVSHEKLVEDLRPLLHERAVVLIKGSRIMRMEQVVAQLLAEGGHHASVVV